ncbi:MAG TPA: GAF domain-containing sensor histidine kinase [Solirubrobacteraceae bacterium]|nr:GAF domain-containing sensor histidine kinase [Solirubrobacteraceae bacterium]
MSERQAQEGPGRATERLLAACRALTSGAGPAQLERRLPALAVEVTGARSATLVVLDEHQAGFARRLTTRGDGAAAGLDEDEERRLVWAVHAAAVADGGANDGDLFTLPATLADGGATDVLVAPLLDRSWLHGWLCAVGVDGDAAGEALALLVRWAGMALSNARLVEDARVREIELVRAVRTLGAVGRIAESVTREPHIGKVLDRVVGEALALVDARFVLALLVEGDELVVASHAGPLARDIRALRLPIGGHTVLTEALADGQPRQVDSFVRRDLLSGDGDIGRADQRGVLAPMVFRGEPVGLLVAIEGLRPDGGFDDEAVQLLRSFAAGASSAVAGARLVEEDRLRRTLAATEEERRRWARELHDETLQDLGVLRIGLAMALKSDADLRPAVQSAADGLADEIARLRGLINELRPVMLDELGLGPALRALVERTRERGSFRVEARIGLGTDERLAHDVEVVAYRVTQEALTNVAKHAQPQHVTVTVERVGGTLDVRVADDGVGFEPRDRTDGAGLLGMRERVALTGGQLTIASRRGFGTRVRASLPVAR